MSALIDSMTTGGYGGYSDEDDGVGASSGAYYAGTGTNFAAGMFQSLTALGTGYLSKRMDIDLQTRIAGAQPYPGLRTTQNGIGGYGAVTRTPTGQSVASFNLSALMPLALVGLVVYFVARKA